MIRILIADADPAARRAHLYRPRAQIDRPGR